MTDHDSIARCLAFIGERLATVARRHAREPGHSEGQLRALELLAAACVAEAARAAAEAPPPVRPEPVGPLLPAPDPGLRGAWAPPERGST